MVLLLYFFSNFQIYQRRSASNGIILVAHREDVSSSIGKKNWKKTRHY